MAANVLKLEYKSFYSHLRQLNDEQLQTLEFAFGFAHVDSSELCRIDSGEIVTDKKTLPVTIGDDNRFTLPTERALKLANAQLHLQIQQRPNQCDLSVLVRVKPVLLEQGLKAADLPVYAQAFDAFFEEMGGLFSFLMPKPKGVQVFVRDSETLPASLQSYYQNNGSLVLPKDSFAKLNQDDVRSLEVVKIVAAM